MKTDFWPYPRASDWEILVAGLLSPQMMLMLLVQEPPFENHCCRRTSYSSSPRHQHQRIMDLFKARNHHYITSNQLSARNIGLQYIFSSRIKNILSPNCASAMIQMLRIHLFRAVFPSEASSRICEILISATSATELVRWDRLLFGILDDVHV